MDIRQITPTFAVSPQINPEDIQTLADLGYRAIIDNRPNAEAGPAHDSDAMAEAAKAAGIEFRYLPYNPGMLTIELADAFDAAIAELDGPVLAYCRSGTRSSHLWALSQAQSRDVDDIVTLAAHAGYDVSGLADLIASRSI